MFWLYASLLPFVCFESNWINRKEWVLTQRSPSQSHHHPWRCFVIYTITVKQWLANILVQIISCHFYSFFCSLHYSKSSFTEYLQFKKHWGKLRKKITYTKRIGTCLKYEQFLFSLSSTWLREERGKKKLERLFYPTLFPLCTKRNSRCLDAWRLLCRRFHSQSHSQEWLYDQNARTTQVFLLLLHGVGEKKNRLVFRWLL